MRFFIHIGRVIYLGGMLLLGLLMIPAARAQNTPDQILYAIASSSEKNIIVYTIYMVNIDSGLKTQIGIIDSFGIHAGWSPDGQYIYLTDYNESYQRTMTLVNVATNHRQTIPDPLDENQCTRPFWWSPDGAWLAYATHDDPQGLLKILNPATADIQTLPDADVPYAQVSWSHDGRYIAYRVSHLATGYRVAIWDVQHQRTVSILDVASFYQWSPTENRLAYSAAGSQHTIVYNITDGTKQQYTNGDIGSWSPNGRFLAIHQKDVNAKYLLWVIDVVANKTLELDGVISEPGSGASAVWSADGRYLAIPIIDDPLDPKRTVYVLDTVDTSSRRLTVDSLYYNELAWSPVGNWLAFASRADRGGGTPFTALWLFDVDHQSHQTFEVAISENYHYDGLFKWSADGRYMIVRTQPIVSIALIDKEVGQLNSIADSIRTIEMVRGSPDGSKIALISRLSTSPDLYVFTPENDTLRNITNTPDVAEIFIGWRGTKRNETLFYCGEG